MTALPAIPRPGCGYHPGVEQVKGIISAVWFKEMANRDYRALAKSLDFAIVAMSLRYDGNQIPARAQTVYSAGLRRMAELSGRPELLGVPIVFFRKQNQHADSNPHNRPLL